MTLYFIGLGLHDEKDISVKGLEAAKSCDKLYLDFYTAVLGCKVEKLEELLGKKIEKATRQVVESHPEEILKAAKRGNAAFLVVGDPLTATTHIDLMMRARKEGVKMEVIHNASVLTAVAITGLQVYKFGRTGSIPFEEKNFASETPYNVLASNKAGSLHTLLLLDLRPDEEKFMSVNDAIRQMLKLELKKKENAFTENTMVVGCAQLGSSDAVIKYGKARDVVREDFGRGMHCLIVPGSLHFMEEEALSRFALQQREQ